MIVIHLEICKKSGKMHFDSWQYRFLNYRSFNYLHDTIMKRQKFKKIINLNIPYFPFNVTIFSQNEVLMNIDNLEENSEKEVNISN